MMRDLLDRFSRCGYGMREVDWGKLPMGPDRRTQREDILKSRSKGEEREKGRGVIQNSLRKGTARWVSKKRLAHENQKLWKERV
jgi:hypothetical protein